MIGNPPSQALTGALRSALYPLVRLMLAKGMTYPFLADLLKEVFVEVSEREFKLDNKPQTDSRISLLSGVHRKDVRRLRQAPAALAEAMPRSVSLGAQLAAAWIGLPQYLDAEGRPCPLPRFARKGGEVSFEGLVESVSKDIRPRAVLDEWLRLGVVHLDDEDRVVLNTASFVPQCGFDEKAYYLGHNLRDHAAAAAHNLLGEGPPLIERSVHYNALSPASIAALRALAEEDGKKVIQRLVGEALKLEESDAADPAPKERMTFGIYFYSEAVQPAEQAKSHDSPA
ncbi:MAG: hypothetical protein KGZ83_19105 [Sulfuricella sp.]|nr:hypothetical protein [Sulfuricella sp.]